LRQFDCQKQRLHGIRVIGMPSRRKPRADRRFEMLKRTLEVLSDGGEKKGTRSYDSRRADSDDFMAGIWVRKWLVEEQVPPPGMGMLRPGRHKDLKPGDPIIMEMIGWFEIGTTDTLDTAPPVTVRGAYLAARAIFDAEARLRFPE
jgi:hypothetical protein